MTRRPGENVGYSPLWGCAGDRVQVHCGTVWGDACLTRRQICPQISATIHLTTISTRSLVQLQSGEQPPHSLQQQRRMPWGLNEADIEICQYLSLAANPLPSCQQYKSKQVYEVELLTRTAFIFPSIAKEPVSSSKQFMWRKCSEWLHRPTVLTPLQRAPQASLEASLSIMYRRVLVCQRPWRIPHRPLFHDPLHVKERASRGRFGGKTDALLS